MENIKITEQTLGQKRVMLDFNPTESDVVGQIKKKSAELIDILQSFVTDDSSIEKLRVIGKAQMDIEQACMFAVKSNFIK